MLDELWLQEARREAKGAQVPDSDLNTSMTRLVARLELQRAVDDEEVVRRFDAILARAQTAGLCH